MGTNLDFIQGAEVAVTAVVGTGSDTAFDTFVSMFHGEIPPLKDFTCSMAKISACKTGIFFHAYFFHASTNNSPPWQISSWDNPPNPKITVLATGSPSIK